MPTFLTHDEPVLIWTGRAMLDGRLSVPEDAPAVVILAGLADTAHNTGFRHIAALLNSEGVATLAVDLLTADEGQFDSRTGHFRTDVVLLGDRIRDVVRWLPRVDSTRGLPMMLLGAGTVAAAAIVVASTFRHDFEALLLISPRTDLAGESIRRVKAPTLLVVPDSDLAVLRMNRDAESEMTTETKLVVIPDSTRLLDDSATADAAGYAVVTWALLHTQVGAYA
jgi:dienelactone hydrolase